MERKIREKHREKIIDYLRGDCVYLHELVSTFHLEFGNRLTIGGSSMHQIKQFHTFERGDADYDTEIRKQFYHGGRNQCFESGIIYGDITVYDVNSMYPHVMRDYPHPLSTGMVISDQITDNTCFVVAEGINRGAFAQRTKDGLDFTAPRGKFHTSIHEWKAAMETGRFEGRVTEAYQFAQQGCFDIFVDHFFDLRKKAKTAGDKARDLLYKFTLNSGSGKFAQNPENFFDYELSRADECLNDPCPHCAATRVCRQKCSMCWRLNEGEEPEHCMFCNGSGRKWSYAEGNDDYIIWQARPRTAYFSNVATGSSITGAGRAVLMRGLSRVERVLYTDTDSIIGMGKCSLNLSDTELGAWKIEARANAIAISGKKMYCLYSYDESPGAERVKLPNKRWGWVVKKANKGVRLTGSQLLKTAMGNTVEYESPVPIFERTGKIKWLKRKIRSTIRSTV